MSKPVGHRKMTLAKAAPAFGWTKDQVVKARAHGKTIVANMRAGNGLNGGIPDLLKSLEITKNELVELVGISPSTLDNLCDHPYVTSRKVIEKFHTFFFG